MSPRVGEPSPRSDDDRTAADDPRTVVARERLMREAERFTHVGSFAYCSADGALQWSDELFRIFGLDPATAAPLDASGFEAALHPDDVSRVRATLARARDGQLPPVDFRVRRPDGSYRCVQMQGARVPGGAGAPVRWVGTLQDVTEQRHLEEALLQARKLEVLGQLAGGVAHDFNNLLAVMLLATDELADCIRHAALDELRTAIEHGVALTRQMLTFGRKAALEPRSFEVAGHVRQCVAMGARLLGDAARIEVDDLTGSGAVFVDPAQLQHALLNLLINARDAMPRGGTIRVSAARRTISLPPPDIRPALDPGEYVEIVVRDEGEGIDARTLAHMFEPFFTTKPGGTGLGLATVFGTMRLSGGGVRVQSSATSGTSVHVFVPAAQTGPVEPPRGAASQPAPGRGRRVLVLDDRVELQQSIARVLRAAGYEPICVQELEVLMCEPWRWAGAIEALVTDVSMRGPHGPDVARRLWEFAPRLPVLFVSGHPRPELPATGVAPVAFLHKPIRSLELVERLGALLEPER